MYPLACGAQLFEHVVGLLRVEFAQEHERFEHEAIVPITMPFAENEIAALVHKPLLERGVAKFNQTFERVIFERDGIVIEITEKDRAQVGAVAQACAQAIERAGAYTLLAIILRRLNKQ